MLVSLACVFSFACKTGSADIFAPLEGVADKTTKRRESVLLAETIRGATWLGSEGETSPSFVQKKCG
jgi:hypothetical protein